MPILGEGPFVASWLFPQAVSSCTHVARYFKKKRKTFSTPGMLMRVRAAKSIPPDPNMRHAAGKVKDASWVYVRILS